MAYGAALIDARRQFAHGRDLFRDLLTQQHATCAGFGSLPDDDFQRVCHAHMMGIEAVATRQHLVNKLLGCLAFGHQHTAVAGSGGGAHACSRSTQRDFGVA